MTYDIAVKLNNIDTGIEISTDDRRLSKEEIRALNNVFWEYQESLEGIFNIEIDEGWVEWKFRLYVRDGGYLSEGYSKEEVDQVRKELVELITKSLPSKSIKCIGFDN